MPKFKLSILSLLFLLVFTAGCGAGKSSQTVNQTITMSDYAYTPATMQVKVGETLTLKLVNDGQLSHEIMFGKQVKKVGNRPAGYEIDLFDYAGVVPEVKILSGDVTTHQADSHSGFMLTFPKKGDSAALTFPITAKMVGEWEIGCFSQDGVHYDAGMKGKLAVTNE